MVFAWVWLCIPAAIVHPCPSQATKMLACEHPSAVFLWCLVACEMRVAVSQNVAVVGWGPAVNPLCQCVSNACPRRGALCLALDPCCDDCLILLLLLLVQCKKHQVLTCVHTELSVCSHLLSLCSVVRTRTVVDIIADFSHTSNCYLWVQLVHMDGDCSPERLGTRDHVHSAA